MFSKKILLSIAVVTALSTGCASIVTKSSYPVTINSMPSEAKIEITDKKGIVVYTGYTPSTVKLKAGSGFFGKARYQVKFTKEGYESKVSPIEFKLDGWYFGNILFGGFIGMLIVDPATGAMYKLETEFVNETLIKSSSTTATNPELKILSMNEIPTEWKKHLVQMN